jgi:phage FluMu protein Com
MVLIMKLEIESNGFKNVECPSCKTVFTIRVPPIFEAAGIISPLERIANALREYINESEAVKRLENIELLTFSVALHRTDKDTFTLGYPCLSVTEYGEEP